MYSSAAAQDQAVIQQQIDSLTVLRASYLEKIGMLDEQLSELETALRIRQVEQLEAAELVLMTNMEASLRTQPAPGARVLRVIPEHTPLAALDYNEAYWKVRYMGTEGWIMRLFLDEGDGSEAFKASLAASEKRHTTHAMGKSNRKEERLGKDLLVTSFGTYPPDHAGGVTVHFSFEHLDSTRTVREIAFSVTPYNREGKAERGLNSGVSTRRLRRFGPISVYDGEREYQFENVWYNEMIHCAEIDRVDVVYSDGSRKTHINEVDEVLSRTIPNDCSIAVANRAGPQEMSN